jgi:hypothetical protein
MAALGQGKKWHIGNIPQKRSFLGDETFYFREKMAHLHIDAVGEPSF